jgi:hypothetical protein
MPWQPALLATYFKEYSFADKRAVHFCSPSPMGQWKSYCSRCWVALPHRLSFVSNTEQTPIPQKGENVSGAVRRP